MFFPPVREAEIKRFFERTGLAESWNPEPTMPAVYY